MTDSALDFFPGGKGANQAVAAARLGAAVNLECAVGLIDDFLVPIALESLTEAGVYTNPLHYTDQRTGVAVIVVTPDGENRIVVAPGANAVLDYDADVGLRGGESVLCQLEVPMETVARVAEEAGWFCLNAAPARFVPAGIIDRADLVVVNRHEFDALGAAPKLLALTLGAEGARLLENGNEVVRARPPKINAVDGTAAGDAFTACLVVSILEKRDREEALRRACAAGAIAASRHGAQPSLPTGVEIDEILAR